MAQDTSTTKKWYQSKLVLLGLVMAIVGGVYLAYHWLSGAGVTPEQINAIETALPGTADAVKQAIEEKNYLAALTAIGGFLAFIWRTWFTEGSPIKFK